MYTQFRIHRTIQEFDGATITLRDSYMYVLTDLFNCSIYYVCTSVLYAVLYVYSSARGFMKDGEWLREVGYDEN